eukprot:Opistho-2@45546
MAATTFDAYALVEVGKPLQLVTLDLPALKATEVRVEVTHCGICRSDVDFIDNKYGPVPLPLVAGHEVVGIVREVGALVKHIHVGHRVGVGPLRSSCADCSWCASGRDNLCATKELTIANGNKGGFAKWIQLDSHYTFPIPDALSSEAAAPLLCAGVTVYYPIVRHTTPDMTVGILGIGGLGHLGVRFAAKRGNKVVAFSTSPSKEKEAKHFGAHSFVNIKDPQQMAGAAKSLDFLLSTVDANINWMEYLQLMKPDGKICVVGASMGPINIPAGLLSKSAIECRLLKLLHRGACQWPVWTAWKITDLLQYIQAGQALLNRMRCDLQHSFSPAAGSFRISRAEPHDIHMYIYIYIH